jgi:glycerol-3-phosphate dehydrogenase subunit C
VVEQCYLCDLCYLTKCPYVPPHEWNLDFPHLMLQAKAVKGYKAEGRVEGRDKTLTGTDRSAPGRHPGGSRRGQCAEQRRRGILEDGAASARRAKLPEYHSNTLRKRRRRADRAIAVARRRARPPARSRCSRPATATATSPVSGEDLVAVFEHNGIPVTLADKERCCGMPKLELGDLESVREAKDVNIPMLAKLVDEGWDIVAPCRPAC